MRKRIIVLPLLILGIIGVLLCYKSPDPTSKVLDRVAACMECCPDSALKLLQSIDDTITSSWKGETQAKYALLYAQACDKNQILVTNDSLVQIAVDYYKNSERSLDAAKSYFYLGCVYRNMHQDAMAVDAYLRALEKMPLNKSHKLWMQIYFNLGERYYNQSLYGNSMDMYRKCLKKTEELKDSSLLFFPYRGIAKTFLVKEKNDSALMYYQKALDISRKIHNSYWEASVLNDMSLTYLYLKDTLAAEKNISIAIKINKQATNLYLRGKLYFLKNELDSAKNYLLQACRVYNIFTRTSCHELLYEIERRAKNHVAAYAHNDSFKICRDSVSSIKHYQEIQTLNTQYALKQQQLENQRRNENLYWIIGLSFLFLVLTGLICYLRLALSFQKTLLRQEWLNHRDQKQTINHYLEEKLDTTLSLEATISSFKKEKLQQGLDLFNVDPWCDKLKDVATQIQTGDYMSKQEQQLLFQTLDACFKDFIEEIYKIYPKINKEDVYYGILVNVGFKSRTIVYCLKASSGTLRTRKARLKKEMAEDTFKLLFNQEMK